MNTDIPIAITLTVSAAIVVATFVSLFRTTASRRRALIGFAGWFALVATIGGAHLFVPGVLGAAQLGVMVSLPILAMSFAALTNQRLREIVLQAPISLLVAVNAVRVLGVTFLILLVQDRLSPTFALSAGWGDIVVGLAAFPLAQWLKRRPANSRGVIALWNTAGLLDLIAAVALGVMSSPGTPLNLIREVPGSAIMTTLPYLEIPAFLVPLLMTSHVLIFYKISRRSAHVIEREAMVAQPL